MPLDLQGIRQLCCETFLAAENSRSFCWRETEEMPLPGMPRDTSSPRGPTTNCPRLRTHLCFSNGEEFARHREAIVLSIFRERRLPFEDLADLYDMLPSLLDTFGQFFGNRRARALPAMLWITPLYVSTRSPAIIGRARVTDRVLAKDAVGRPGKEVRHFRLRFGLGDEPLHLQLMRLHLFVPSDREDDSPLLRMTRSRVGAYAAGERFEVREENLGLARLGEDDHWLARGYFPAHGPFLVPSRGDVPGYIGFRVLILARMRPAWRSRFHAEVNQVVLPLDPRSGRLVDANTVVRDFPQFVQQYPGLESLLCQHALGWRDP